MKYDADFQKKKICPKMCAYTESNVLNADKIWIDLQKIQIEVKFKFTTKN